MFPHDWHSASCSLLAPACASRTAESAKELSVLFLRKVRATARPDRAARGTRGGMSGSDDDEIVFVGETRDGSALEGDAKRVRYEVSDGPALATEIPSRTELSPDPTAERYDEYAPPLFRLFKTENTHNEACVSVSDLVRGPVRWAVVSNFKIDLDFMQDHAPELLAIPRLHWLHGQDDLPNWIRANCSNKTETGEWTTLKPATPQWGTHHSKFFLLVFPAGCRVVVHTANLCYGDLTAMSNAAWWQDFPKTVSYTHQTLPTKA